MQRCEWMIGKPDFYVSYHDKIWGRPCHQEQELFEWLILEMFSTGLSWQIVLSKKGNFEEAFDHFNPRIVSQYDEEKIEALLNNASIIRHRRKIEAAIQNAKAFLSVQEEFGSFDSYIWSFTDGQTIHRDGETRKTRSKLSDELTKDLKRRNFRWVGSVTIYSYLQAIGIINDHDSRCFCHQSIMKKS